MENETILDIFSESDIEIPQNVIELLSNIMDENDSLDTEIQMDPVSYINLLFPDEKSLDNINDVADSLKSKLSFVKKQIENELVEYCNNSESCPQLIENTSLQMSQLSESIKFLNEQSIHSERMVRDVTIDIKRLENAKRNLSYSISTLNHLHLLAVGTQDLKESLINGNYDKIKESIGGMLGVEQFFDKFDFIPQVHGVLDDLKLLKEELAVKLKQDFFTLCQAAFDHSPVNPRLMNDLTRIVEIAFKPLQQELIECFIRFPLKEYEEQFILSHENSWLDRLNRRFSFIKRVLINYDEAYNLWFPLSWDVDNIIVSSMCELTRTSIESIMNERKDDIDIKLFLSAIQATVAFEDFMDKRFSVQFNGEIETQKADLVKFNYIGMISRCFERYFYIFFDAQDRNLSYLINKFATTVKSSGSILGLLNTSKGTEDGGVMKLTQMDEEVDQHTNYVLPCAGELFMCYKKCLIQFSKMSILFSIDTLIDLFKKYLKEFNNRILQHGLPKNVNQRFSIVKEQDKGVSKDEIASCSSVIVTAEYIIDVTGQLEKKISDIVNNKSSKVQDFSEIYDIYQLDIDKGINHLVDMVDNLCDPFLTSMLRIGWSSHSSVGDHSSYVSGISNALKQLFPFIRDHFNTSRKCYFIFCLKFINSFLSKFISNVYKCKPISHTGVEQLLLDSQSLKNFLLFLPNINAGLNFDQDPSYLEYVKESMKNLEIKLKFVLTSHNPINGFIEKYLSVAPTDSLEDFSKVLEMKSLKKSEQNLLVESFQAALRIR